MTDRALFFSHRSGGHKLFDAGGGQFVPVGSRIPGKLGGRRAVET